MKTHTAPATRSAAFTLIEMMAAVMIIALIIGIVTPTLVQVMESNRLSQTGQGLLYKISMGRQLAQTENRPIELRFYRYNDENGSLGYHATQLFYYDETANEREAADSPFYFSSGIMIAEKDLSPLLGTNAEEAPFAQLEPFKSRQAQYQRVVFYPNGSTNINAALSDAYVTLAYTRDAEMASNETPKNFYTIQIDPVNGSTKTYRPN